MKGFRDFVCAATSSGARRRVHDRRAFASVIAAFTKVLLEAVGKVRPRLTSPQLA